MVHDPWASLSMSVLSVMSLGAGVFFFRRTREVVL